jgi:ribonuclease HI
MTSYKGCGIGVTMIRPQRESINYALQLMLMASNIIAEHKTLLVGLRFAKGVGVKRVVLYSDSQLVINQIFREYKVGVKSNLQGI